MHFLAFYRWVRGSSWSHICSTALHNCISPILASLFAGNAIVVKCSEQVIWSTSWYISAVRMCLVACGLPPDLVQVVCCYPTEAEALTTSPYIKSVNQFLLLARYSTLYPNQAHHVYWKRNSWPKGPSSFHRPPYTRNSRAWRQRSMYYSSRDQPQPMGFNLDARSIVSHFGIFLILNNFATAKILVKIALASRDSLFIRPNTKVR